VADSHKESWLQLDAEPVDLMVAQEAVGRFHAAHVGGGENVPDRDVLEAEWEFRKIYFLGYN
jgi:hypothetical protein